MLLKEVGTRAQQDFEPQDHLALGAQLDLIDFQTGAAVAGAKYSPAPVLLDILICPAWFLGLGDACLHTTALPMNGVHAAIAAKPGHPHCDLWTGRRLLSRQWRCLMCTGSCTCGELLRC